MNELSWLEINLSRLDANLSWWRKLVAAGPSIEGIPQRPHTRHPTRICAVVKANAYGLGAVTIGQRLSAAGADMLAVYTPAQAEELVYAGVTTPILVLQPTRELERTEAVHAAAQAGRLHLAINDPAQLSMIDGLGRALACRLPIHLHLDTGMSRAGLSAAELAAMLQALPRYVNTRLVGLWSHFAAAGEDVSFAYEQVERLERALADNRAALDALAPPPELIVHTAATAAACRDRRFQKDMVRVGIGLYGYGPELLAGQPGPLLPFDAPLQPVFRWIARIIHLQNYSRGTSVGYGCTHRLNRDSLLGVVPVGYADGYPLALSNKGAVRLINTTPGLAHALAPVLGKVSMDQIVIDLTDFPRTQTGQMVELVSDDPASRLALPALAGAAGTSPYEMLCRLSPRLPRKYVSIEVPHPEFPALARTPAPGLAAGVN
jgi:alanine racemase